MIHRLFPPVTYIPAHDLHVTTGQFLVRQLITEAKSFSQPSIECLTRIEKNSDCMSGTLTVLRKTLAGVVWC